MGIAHSLPAAYTGTSLCATRSLGTGDCTPSQGARKASNSQSGGSEHTYGAGPEQILGLVRNGQTDNDHSCRRS